MAEIQGASRSDIESFVSSLVDDTVEKISGANIESGQRTPPGWTPRTKFFSGALTPEEDNPDIDKEIQSRSSPSTIGLIGRVKPNNANGTITIEITLTFSIYYRVFPTPVDIAESDNELPTVYRKYTLIDSGTNTEEIESTSLGVSTTVTIDVANTSTGILQSASDDVQEALNSKIRSAINNHVAHQPDLYRDDFEFEEGFLSEHQELDSDEFVKELNSATSGEDSDYLPIPEFEVKIRLLEALDETSPIAEEPETTVIRIDATNRSDPEPDFGDLDLATYETSLELRGRETTQFVPMTFEDVPEGFRYNPSVPGQGHNCTAEWTENGDGIRSKTVPIYRQPFFGHKQFPEQANPLFDRLSEDPLPVLRAIRQELKRYKNNEWEDRLNQAIQEAENPETDPIVATIRNDIRRFEEEIDRYDQGVSILEDDDEARELFQQVNLAFLRKVRRGDPWDEDTDLEYPGWRPFQIVFIVSLIPDILHEERNFNPRQHNRNVADLLYFPTGGGKTEAYLALLVFTALFDRRRGKEFGLSAMMRFPLRLLSLQQLQRVVEILVHADEVRKEAGYGGEPLSAGFFTGNTANSLGGILKTEFNGWYPSYPQTEEILDKTRAKLREFEKRWNEIDGNDLEQVKREDYRVVEKCPICRADVELIFNTDTDRIEHHCSSSSCDREKLNVHVTDIDIYRAVPTIVLGTQDKLAALGYNYRFRTLAGYVTHRCPKHGYTHRHDECQMTFFCRRDDEIEDNGGLEPVKYDHPVPTLCLQDELHLVNEDLGTFESHYYSAYEQHLKWLAEKREIEYYQPKKIAATATIEESDNQVRHLYGGIDTIRFPAPGPAYRESAYTKTDDSKVQRHYVGVVPWNRSQINSIIRTLEMHQRRIQDWLADPAAAMDEFDFDELSDPDEFEKLLGHYYTLVTYVISKFEGGRVYKSAETQVNDNLTADGYDPIQRFEMQGNTDADDMADMLNRFEQVGEENGTTHEDLEGLITATSSISHGVDIDALGYMLFFNAPPRMSEYIQASSRVGRAYPGFVLNVFDPIGERDRSHYHYFHKYHEYLDRLVEPVAINRWAKFSVDRTFPGLFMSLLYIKYFDEISEETGWFQNRAHPRKIRKAEQTGVVDQDQIIQELIEIYGEDWETGSCPFYDRIEELVHITFNNIQGGTDEEIEGCLAGRVMLSLRDVDDPIDIKPSYRHEDAFEAVGVDTR